jgi:hypothetical protein
VNFDDYRNGNTQLSETDAVYDGSSGTFNWWGAVGSPGGKVIDGDVPVRKRKKKRDAAK